jgi:hypothetical protein
MCRKLRILLAPWLIGALVAGNSSSAFAFQQKPPADSDEDADTPDEEAEPKGDPRLERAFTVMENAPDSVIDAGPEAIENYLIKNGINPTELQAMGSQVQALGFPGWDLLKCGATLVYVAGSNAIPAAKAIRIAKLVKKIGAKRFARLIKAFRKGDEKGLKKVLSQSGISAKWFFEIDMIKENCSF